MGVELVLAVAAFVERAKEAAMVLMKRRSVDVARHYRSIYMRIFRGVSDMQNQLAGVKLNVLVTGNVLDFQLPGGHAHKEAGGFWNFHHDLRVVPGTARHP